MAVMVGRGKNFNSDNSSEFIVRQHKFNLPESSLLKFLPLIYHHGHFLSTTCISQLFSPWPFCIGPNLFLSRSYKNKTYNQYWLEYSLQSSTFNIDHPLVYPCTVYLFTNVYSRVPLYLRMHPYTHMLYSHLTLIYMFTSIYHMCTHT